MVSKIKKKIGEFKIYSHTIILFVSIFFCFFLFHLQVIYSVELLAVIIGFLTFIYELYGTYINNIKKEEELFKNKLSKFFLENLFSTLATDVPINLFEVIDEFKCEEYNSCLSDLETLRKFIVGINIKLSFYKLMGFNSVVEIISKNIITIDEGIVILKNDINSLKINNAKKKQVDNNIKSLEKNIQTLFENIFSLYM